MAYVHYTAPVHMPVYSTVHTVYQSAPVAVVPDLDHTAKAAELASKDMKQKFDMRDAHQKLAALSRAESADEEAVRGADARARSARAGADAARLQVELTRAAVAPAEERAKKAEEAVGPAQEKAAKAKEAVEAQSDDCAAKRGVTDATTKERIEHDLSPQRVRYITSPAPTVYPTAAYAPGLPLYVAPPPMVHAMPDAEHASKAVELWSRDLKERAALTEADAKLAVLAREEAAARAEAEAAEAQAQAAKAHAEQAAKAADDAAAEADAAELRAKKWAGEAEAAQDQAVQSKAAAQEQRDECDKQRDANCTTEREIVTHALSPQRVRYVQHPVAPPMVFSNASITA